VNTEQINTTAKAKRLAGFYNMAPNLFWSVLSLVPVFIFCYNYLSVNLLLFFTGVSILPAFLPNSAIHTMQISERPMIYKKLGIGFVQRLSQNGKIVNSLIRRKYPNYKALRQNEKSIKGLLNQTCAFEKFHLTLLVFFCLAGFYAFSKGFTKWTAIIFLLNVLYNVYPVLMQQYIRIKLSVFMKKNNTNYLTENKIF
jgi:hypothetical protein